jgi:hypothetical protein
MEPNALLLRQFIGLLQQLWITDVDEYGAISGMNEWQAEPKHTEKACFSAALPATDPKWLDSGSNPGHRGGKPATNHLSYGTAQVHLTTAKLARSNRRCKAKQTRSTHFTANVNGTKIFLGGKGRQMLKADNFTDISEAKQGVFWDVMPCGSCKNRRFGET